MWVARPRVHTQGFMSMFLKNPIKKKQYKKSKLGVYIFISIYIYMCVRIVTKNIKNIKARACAFYCWRATLRGVGGEARRPEGPGSGPEAWPEAK